MSDNSTTIRVENLSKVFKVYQKPFDMIRELFSHRKMYREFSALKDITFKMKRGEIIGVVGRNGAGKSTLLKILSGTLDKTSGEVDICGAISSILELGTGFHPDYSGRENIVMGGLCLGMTKEEVMEKTDDIIAFSELEDVIDQPFKTYSSGMQARLTFSTAISVNPEVLIIDEALSVGDAKFQRKCYRRMDELRQRGKTILIVTHSLDTVTSFCNRAILLEKGDILEDGDPKYVADCYHNLLFGTSKDDNEKKLDTRILEANEEKDPVNHFCMVEDVQTPEILSINNLNKTQEVTGIEWLTKLENGRIPKTNDELRDLALQYLKIELRKPEPSEYRYGNGKAEILDFGILDQNGNKINRLQSRQKYLFFFYTLFLDDIQDPHVGFLIRDIKGKDLFGVNNQSQGIQISAKQRGSLITVLAEITMSLTNHEFFLGFAVALENEEKCDMRFDALQFEVINREGIFQTSIVDLSAKIKIESG